MENSYVKPLAIVLVIAIGLSLLTASQNNTPNFSEQTQLKKFASPEELNTFLESTSSGYYGMDMVRAETMQVGAPVAAPSGGDGKSVDYSTTNVQIAGVDEADFLKNDGRYIYTISGSDVVIVDAFPAENGKIIATINLSGTNPSNLYVNGDRLVVLGDIYNYYGGPYPYMKGGVAEGMPAPESNQPTPAEPDFVVEKIAMPSIWPGPASEPTTYIKVYDISDRSNPVLKRDLNLNGSYQNSRMVGDYVYSIVNVPAYRDRPMPMFAPNQRGFPDIYYFAVPSYGYQYTNVLSVNLLNDDQDIQNKVFLLGYSSNLFVSENNIYMVYQKQLDESYIFYRIFDEVYAPVLPSDVVSEINSIRASGKSEFRKRGEIQLVMEDWAQSNPQLSSQFYQNVQKKYDEIQAQFDRERDRSVIHKVAISNGNIDYVAQGEVPGTPLNQFSMDEHNGYFRIATTTNNWREQPNNNLYVLDGGMNVFGSLEDLAKGERIYSARFIGDRAYLVTFQRIDPLFVLDLSDPSAPKILGELKIPGVSEYLHPYDENTIIGVGRSTEDIQDRVTFKGIKISLFDVSDVANPVEKAKIEIGDQGTYSDALYDHKAFLFSKEKNLLVLPMTVYEKKTGDYYGSPVFNGAYVFDITSDSISIKGRVTHTNETEIWNNNVRRSLYIENVLYTVSNSMIKVNSLSDLTEINKIGLPQSFYGGPIIY